MCPSTTILSAPVLFLWVFFGHKIHIVFCFLFFLHFPCLLNLVHIISLIQSCVTSMLPDPVINSWCVSPLFTVGTKILSENNLEKEKFIWGSWFQRFSAWLADSLTVGAQWSHSQKVEKEKLLTSRLPWSREQGEGGTEKISTSKACPKSPTSSTMPHLPTVAPHLAQPN